MKIYENVDGHIGKIQVESEVAVPVGASSVGVQFRRSGQTGQATLVIDDAAVGTLAVPFAMSIMSSIGPSVGFDHGSPVSQRYPKGFAFEGRLHRIDIQLLNESEAEALDQARTDAQATLNRQ